MKLLITGASGFLGRSVVREAVRKGHDVRAMVRPSAEVSGHLWENGSGVEIVRCDLRSKERLDEALWGVDTVIHLAAAKTGDLYDQLGGTVVTTENLLAAMSEAGTRRIVLVSSFAIFDYRALWTLSRLDESSPLERRPEDRDAYAHTKLLQEELVRSYAQDHDLQYSVVRPGVIYGPGEVWTARLGVRLSPRWWIRTGSWARLPLTYVDNCAEAVVLCASCDAAVGQTFNVVDDETPTQRRYSRMLRRYLQPRPRVVPIAWTAMRFLVFCAWCANRLLFRGRARLPQILRRASFEARSKPLRYTHRKLTKATGWSPRYSLPQALERCFSRADERVERTDKAINGKVVHSSAPSVNDGEHVP